MERLTRRPVVRPRPSGLHVERDAEDPVLQPVSSRRDRSSATNREIPPRKVSERKVARAEHQPAASSVTAERFPSLSTVAVILAFESSDARIVIVVVAAPLNLPASAAMQILSVSSTV